MRTAGFLSPRALLFSLLGLVLPLTAFAQAPSITVPPANQSVASGDSASFSVSADGAGPLKFQWRRFGTNLAGATNSSLVLTNVSFTQGGLYAVVVTNSLGSVTSAPALLAVDESLTFRILQMSTNGALAVEHNTVTGDDRGGLVVSPSQVFVTGDSSTARFSAADLSGGTALNLIYEGLCSNLRTEQIYVLGNGTNILGYGGGNVNSLIELDPLTGLRNGVIITLSTNFSFTGSPGIFSGYGRVVLMANPNFYDIALPSGRVTRIVQSLSFSRTSTESWAFWGLAEYSGNSLYINYVNGSAIQRLRVAAGGVPTTLAQFSNLADMANIGFSVSRSRWFFHHGGNSQFRSGDETVGSAKAQFSTDPGLPSIHEEPLPQTNYPGDTAVFTVTALGAGPLTYQWRFNSTNIPGANEPSLILTNVQPSTNGNYSVLVSNTLGFTLSRDAFLFVISAPQILTQPASRSAVPGTNTTFTAVVRAAPPVSYQWRHEGTNLPAATNASYTIPFVTSLDVGGYDFIVTNRYGSATSTVAQLQLMVELPYSFKVLGLSNDAVVAEHLNITGTDRGGVVVSSNRVFVTGDTTTGIFSADDLGNPTSLPTLYEALVSDLRSGRAFNLGVGTNLYAPFSSTNTTTLIELNPTTGLRTTNLIPLTQPVPLTSGAGLFSGYGQIVLLSGGRAYSILIPSGVVVDLGAMNTPSHTSSEQWSAFWGLAENFGGNIYLLYVQNSATIARTRVPDGLTTSVANFINLSDMSGLGASVARSRWYFHHQGTSEFGGTNETVGYATASFTVAVNPVVDHFTWEPLPGGVFSGVPFNATVTARAVDDTVLTNYTGQVVLSALTVDTAQPVPLAPASSGNFVNGQWTGPLTVPDPAPALYLRAADYAGRFGVSTPFAVVTTNDLALQVVPSTTTPTLYAALTYTIIITNTGPENSTAVIATNQLPANADYLNATTSQGNCAFNNGTVVCDLGTMPPASGATITLTIVPNALGPLTNFTQVTRAAPEAHPENNSVTHTLPLTFPRITVTDSAALEGDTSANRGTNIFFVSLNTTSAVPITVQFGTVAGTATNVQDYVNRAGTLTFAPGVTGTNVKVTIVTDRAYELDEYYFLNFSNPANALLVRTQALGTILNDDQLPTLLVTNAAITEGNAGNTTLTIPVTLSAPAGVPISLNYATSNGTALAGSDYTAKSGLLYYTNGGTNLNLTITITGDTSGESNEFFYVRFFNPTNINITTQIVAVILNDDPVGVDHFLLSNVAPTQYLNVPFTPTILALDYNNNLASNFAGTVNLSLGQTEVTVGTGDTTWNWPLSVFYMDARCQSIYLASELGGARRLTSLALNVTSLPSKPMSNWVIRLKHTALSSYSGGVTWDNAGWTTVHQNNSLTVTATNWVTFNFTTPFDYDGASNLMIDFTFDDTYYTSPDGYVAATTRPAVRSAYARCDSCNGDPKTWASSPIPSSTTLVPDLRLGGLGGGLNTNRAEPFTNGIWSGELRALSPVQNVSLFAADTNGHTGASQPLTVLLANDLALSVETSANPAPLEQNLILTLTVSNAGPDTATAVFLTNQLPANATYLGATTDHGGFTLNGLTLLADLGPLASQQAAVMTITLQPTGPGALTNLAAARRAEPEIYLLNNQRTNTITIVPLGLTVADISVVEGHTGTTNAIFPVSLTAASTQAVTVTYFTAPNSALAPADYLNATGQLIFPPGVTNLTVPVAVVGDRLNEASEIFRLNLTNATVPILRSQASATILNDDPLPMLTVSDITVVEGRTGQTPASFTISLSAPSGRTVFFNAATIDLDAEAGEDYLGTSVFVVMNAGQTNVVVTVPVQGDGILEPDEKFLLRLSNPSSATLGVAEARATILNDDLGPGYLDHFAWSAIATPQTPGRGVDVSLSARDGTDGLVPFNGAVTLRARTGSNELALAPTNSGAFVNGLWSGTLAFPSAGTNVILTADDGAGHLGDSNPFDVNEANLVLTGETPPEVLIEFPLNCVLTVSNAGPATATAVSFTNRLPADVSFAGAAPSAGTCSYANGVVTCNLGPLTNRGTATISLFLIPWRGGPLTNLSSVFAFEFDPSPGNNFTTNLVAVTGDEDHDGLPDAWESVHGLSSLNPDDANLDLDHDGHTSLQEYIAGTDPNQADSVLKAVVVVQGTSAQVRFTTVLDRRYLVESAPAPAGPWSGVGDEVPGDGDVAIIFDPNPVTGSQRFYRLRVWR